MGWWRVDKMASDGPDGDAAGSHRDHGFTMVEMTTSVAVLVVVLAAAWLLLSASNDNLNAIGNGGQASEGNRAAFAQFERDLGRSKLTYLNASPIIEARGNKCVFLADVKGDDGRPELVTWYADDATNRLMRVVKTAPEDPANPPDLLDSRKFTRANQFDGGAEESSTVLAGIASSTDLPADKPMFEYKASATEPGYDSDPGQIGLIVMHLRNGLPDASENIIDRTSAFRVVAYVINGYR
jgi:prepilin-type N-terminal cleavage/methylation domain-containing protein